MLRSRTLALVPVALCLALPACGGGSEEDAVRDSLRTFAQAAVDGDGDAACGQLTAASREQLQVAGQDCAAIFSKLDDDTKQEAEDQLDEIDDLNVTVNGDKATVEGDESDDASMVREDGDWKLSAGE